MKPLICRVSLKIKLFFTHAIPLFAFYIFLQRKDNPNALNLYQQGRVEEEKGLGSMGVNM